MSGFQVVYDPATHSINVRSVIPGVNYLALAKALQAEIDRINRAASRPAKVPPPPAVTPHPEAIDRTRRQLRKKGLVA